MKQYRYILLVGFLSVFFWSAFHPSNFSNWMMECIPIFIFGTATIMLSERLRISNLSLTLATIYVSLHLVAAHYTYGSVPFGYTIAHWFGSTTNHFDRLIHFSFGLLLFFPFRELFIRFAKRRSFWSYLFVISVIMMISSLYEIWEWWSVRHLPAEVGALFLGGSDVWDAQKDMAMAFLGALLAALVVFLIENFRLYKKFFKAKHC